MRRWVGVLVVSLAVTSYADEGGPVPGAAPVPPPPLELTEPLLRALREVLQRVPQAATADPVDPAWLVPGAAVGPAAPEGVPVVVLDVPTFVAIRSEVAWAQHAVAALQSVAAERERLEGMKKAAERAVDHARQLIEKDVEAGLAQASATEEEWKPKDEVERRNVERMRGSALPRLERRFFPPRRAPRPVAVHPGWPFLAPGETSPPAPPPPIAPEPVKEKKPRRRPAVLLTDELLEAYVKIRARTNGAGRIAPDSSWFVGQPFDAAGYEKLDAEVRWELAALSTLEAWAKHRAPLAATRDELAEMMGTGVPPQIIDHYRAVDRDITLGDERVAELRPTDDGERQNRERATAWRTRILGAPAPAK